MSKFFKNRGYSRRQEDKENLIEVAVLLGLGLPSLAMLTLGSTGVFIGSLLLLVPGPHQPLALPVLATSLPATGVGVFGSASVAGYMLASGM